LAFGHWQDAAGATDNFDFDFDPDPDSDSDCDLESALDDGVALDSACRAIDCAAALIHCNMLEIRVLIGCVDTRALLRTNRV
jgi:hypothetical protein